MLQELGQTIHFSATSIEMVRGIYSTVHLFLKKGLTEKDIWKTYRSVYGQEPFIRIEKKRQGIYRFLNRNIVGGTNYCDIGFELDGSRLVVVSAIDNLMKGAAGQAVHAMNVMCGFDETAGLGFAGLHPDRRCGRLLTVRAKRPFAIASHLEKFARIAKNSKEYQGHGWGCADKDCHGRRSFTKT